MDKYPPELEERMRCFYNSLNEKERRLYAGLEALRIGHGGRNYIASVLECSRNTVSKGACEISDLPKEQVEKFIRKKEKPMIRKSGGGRKSYELTMPIRFGQVYVIPYDYMFACFYRSPCRSATPIPTGGEDNLPYASSIFQILTCINRIGMELTWGARLDMKFLEVLRDHTAGDPMDETVRWTNLVPHEICRILELEHEIKVSNTFVRKLLKKHNDCRRKAQRRTGLKSEVKNRNEQFENIDRLRSEFEITKNPVISMDTRLSSHLTSHFNIKKIPKY